MYFSIFFGSTLAILFHLVLNLPLWLKARPWIFRRFGLDRCRRRLCFGSLPSLKDFDVLLREVTIHNLGIFKVIFLQLSFNGLKTRQANFWSKIKRFCRLQFRQAQWKKIAYLCELFVVSLFICGIKLLVRDSETNRFCDRCWSLVKRVLYNQPFMVFLEATQSHCSRKASSSFFPSGELLSCSSACFRPRLSLGNVEVLFLRADPISVIGPPPSEILVG